jgi:hypothetical protein
MSAIHDKLFLEFEELGESEVRRRLECNEMHILHQEAARAWIALKDAARASRTENWARHAAYAAYAAAAIATMSIITTVIIS